MGRNRISYLLFVVVAVFFIPACAKSNPLPKETTSDDISISPIITDAAKMENTVSAAPEEKITDIVNKLPKFDVTSSSLREDGKWLSVITNTEAGENKSPQLSWSPVKNANYYAIYMFDTSAGDWLHWIAKDLTVTELELGAKLDNSQYIGPYPPSGTHTYEITVYALSEKPDSYGGAFDAPNYNMDKIINRLNTSDGKPGNILAKGVISGTYTYGDIVE